MVKQLIFLFVIVTINLSCTRTANNDSDGPVFCNINQSEVYDLGTDPSVDFSVFNRQKIITFNNVSCPNVDNEPFAAFVSGVSREGVLLNIRDRNPNLPGFSLDMIISGTDLLTVENSFNINNCTVRRSWSGTLNPAGNSMTIISNIDYAGNCQPVFLGDGDLNQ